MRKPSDGCEFAREIRGWRITGVRHVYSVALLKRTSWNDEVGDVVL